MQNNEFALLISEMSYAVSVTQSQSRCRTMQSYLQFYSTNHCWEYTPPWRLSRKHDQWCTSIGCQLCVKTRIKMNNRTSIDKIDLFTASFRKKTTPWPCSWRSNFFAGFKDQTCFSLTNSSPCQSAQVKLPLNSKQQTEYKTYNLYSDWAFGTGTKPRTLVCTTDIRWYIPCTQHILAPSKQCV